MLTASALSCLLLQTCLGWKSTSLDLTRTSGNLPTRTLCISMFWFFPFKCVPWLTRYSLMVAICTTGFNYRKFYVLPTQCFVWIWEQTAIISLYSINWLILIKETESVYCAVRTDCLNIIQSILSFLSSCHGSGQLVADFSQQRPRFDLKSVHVRFAVEKVTLG